MCIVWSGCPVWACREGSGPSAKEKPLTPQRCNVYNPESNQKIERYDLDSTIIVNIF